MILKESSEILN